MADVYKGLTIRIGADTAPLSRAMDSIKKELSAVQSSLRLVQQGLRFDPSNATAMKQNIGLVSEKTEMLASEFQTLKSKIEQAAEESPALLDLAKSTEHLAAKATEANNKYNNVNQQLEEMRAEYSKIADEKKLLDKDDFGKTLQNLKEQGIIGDDVIRKYRELTEAHNAYQAEIERLDEAQGLRRTLQEMEKLRSETKMSAQEFAELFHKMSSEHVFGVDGKQIASSRMEVERLNGVISQSEQHANMLEQALRLNPGNMELATAAAKALETAEEGARQQAAEVKREIDEIRATGITEGAESMLEFANATQRATSELSEAERGYDEARASVSRLETEIKQCQEANVDWNEPKFKKLLSDYRDASNELRTMKSRVEAAKIEVLELAQRGRLREAIAAWEQADAKALVYKNRLAQINVQTKNLMSKAVAIRDFGTTFANTVSPLATAALYRTVSAADDLDSAYRDMRKTVDGTEEEFEALKRSAIEFSQTSVVSAADILEIEAMAGQLGIAVENLETFATVASNLDIATDIESEEIAKSMGQLSNIMHWNQDIVEGTRSDYEKFSDSLVRLGNNLPAQESAIMNITNRIAPMGTLLDMSTDQVLAWSAALASTGQGAEAAGTALSKTMSQIETAVAEGGDSLDGFAKVAGMSSDEFAKLWKTDSSSALQSFIEGLHSIDEAGGSVDKTLQDLGITGVRQKQALEGLANTTDVLSQALDMSKSAWTLGGDAAEEARKKTEGFSGAYHMLLNNGKALASVIGDGLVPYLQIASAAASGFADALNGLGGAGKTIVAGVLGLTAASGPVLRLWGQSSIALNMYVDSMKKAGRELGPFAKGLTSMSGAAKLGVAALIAMAAAVVTVVVSALSEAIKASYNYQKATKGMRAAVHGATKETKSWGAAFDGFFDNTKHDRWRKLVDGAAEFADSVREGRKSANEEVAVLNKYKDAISKVGKDGSIAAEDVSEMRSAVEYLNSTLGTSYQISGDAQNGYKLIGGAAGDARKEIEKLIDAQKIQIQWSEYQAEYEQALRDRKNAAKDLEDAQEEYRAAVKEYGEDNEYVKGLKASVDKYQAVYDSYDDSVKSIENRMDLVDDYLDGSGTALERWLAGEGELHDALNQISEASGLDIKDVAKAFDDLGISLEDFEGVSNTQISKIIENFDGTPESIAWAFENGKVKSKEELDAWLDVVDKFGSDVAASAPKKILDAVEDMKSGIGKVGHATGTELPKAFYKGVKSTVAQVFSATSNVQGTVKNGLSGMGVAGQNAGADLIRGVTKGITGKVLDTLLQNIKDVGNQIKKTFNNAVDVKSPSKATMETGKYLIEGLAIGIEKDASLAFRAAEDAAALAMSGFSALTAGEMAVNANNAASMVLNVSFNGVTINDNAAIESQTLELVMALQTLYRTKVGA